MTDTVLPLAAEWQRSGRPVALATVIATWGSSPRPVGSQLAIDDAGHFVGSVSGGCVESAVVETAAEVIRDGRPQRLQFAVANENAWKVGLTCGGSIEVFVEAFATSHETPAVRDLIAAIETGRSAVLVTDLARGTHQLLMADDLAGDDPLAKAAERALARDTSQLLETPEGDVFLRVYQRPLRLVIVGAVHIAQALAPLARVAGFDVTVVDPRARWASPERFPDVRVLRDWPDQALSALRPDRRTAVVTLSHDPKLDDPALVIALRSPAFYIGALGSRRTHESRLERLASEGLSPEQLERIDGPVGLAIGARAPGEIAVSIIAAVIGHARCGATPVSVPPIKATT